MFWFVYYGVIVAPVGQGTPCLSGMCVWSAAEITRCFCLSGGCELVGSC